jgi:hypothetical protein
MMGMLIMQHLIHYYASRMYFNYCASSLFHSIITHGSHVCTTIDSIRMMSVSKFADTVRQMATLMA